MSLADLWDDTDANEASNKPSDGQHEVRINKFEMKDDAKKGTAAFVEFEVIDGDEEGKSVRQMYKLTDAAGGKGPGLAYLKRDLALLGHEDVPGGKLKKVLAEITEEQPMAIIQVKTNGQYCNAFLQGLAENVDAGADDKGKTSDSDKLEVGDKVKDADDNEFEIVSINKKKETAVVKDSDDDESTVDLEDLTKIDADADADAVIEEGDEVTFTDPADAEETLEGEVVSVNTKKDNAVVKVGKKKYTVDLDDLTKAGAESEANWEPAVGDDVKWDDSDGDPQTGTITKILGDQAKVKDSDDDLVKVDLSDLSKAD